MAKMLVPFKLTWSTPVRVLRTLLPQLRPLTLLDLYAVQGGAFFGVMMLYYFNERFGRRVALIAAGWVFNIGVVMQMACGGNIPVFYIGRFVSGLGIGGTTFVIPQFLSESAPAAARGGIVGCVMPP
ncbi:MFS transporter [bacterium]|nr:MFS transporter [bacterium]